MSAQKTEYEIKVKTTDQLYAGTDSDIFLMIRGEFGNSESIRLNALDVIKVTDRTTHSNYFERNQEDNLLYKSDIDLGRIYEIDLRSDMNWGGADWHLSYIQIKRVPNTDDNSDSISSKANEASTFSFNQWINDTKTITKRADDFYSGYSAVNSTKIIYGEPIILEPGNDFSEAITQSISSSINYDEVSYKKTTITNEVGLNVGLGKENSNGPKNAVQKLSGNASLEYTFKHSLEEGITKEYSTTDTNSLTETKQLKITNDTHDIQYYVTIWEVSGHDIKAYTSSCLFDLFMKASVKFIGCKLLLNLSPEQQVEYEKQHGVKISDITKM